MYYIIHIWLHYSNNCCHFRYLEDLGKRYPWYLISYVCTRVVLVIRFEEELGAVCVTWVHVLILLALGRRDHSSISWTLLVTICLTWHISCPTQPSHSSGIMLCWRRFRPHGPLLWHGFSCPTSLSSSSYAQFLSRRMSMAHVSSIKWIPSFIDDCKL